MDKLPEEILLEIMEYFRYSDLKCFRLVCKKFYDASLTFCVVNRENFTYGDKMILSLRGYNFDNFMKILSTTERNFYHFHFVNMEITASFREFVEKQAKYILSLTFDECKIMYHPISFCESINKCTKLKLLELRGMSWPVCNHKVTISLPALETMCISNIPDDMFIILMKTNVKNLHLRVDIPHLNHVIYKRGRLMDLKCVDLWYKCTDEQLMNIANHLNLTIISIINFSYLTEQGLNYFFEKQSRLQRVVMRVGTRKTDTFLVTIAENLKHLKDLKEVEIWDDTNTKYSFDVLNQFLNLTPVHSLDLCFGIDYSGLATIVGYVTASKCLRRLSMQWMHNETYITYIAENFPSLTELKLTRSNGVTTETLQLICQNLKNLKKLVLSDCNAINAFENDVSRLTFSANFKNLEELDLSKNGWLSDSILETCFKLPSLRILNLEYCEGLTAKSFVAMPKNFPCLENLDMYGIEVDNDMLLSTVSLMKRLCELAIWESEPITKHFLSLLYEHSDSLHRVMFMGYFIRSWDKKTFVEAKQCWLSDGYRPKQWYEDDE